MTISRLFTNQPMFVTATATAEFTPDSDPALWGKTYYNVKALSSLKVGDKIYADFSVSEKGVRRMLCAKKDGELFFAIDRRPKMKREEEPAPTSETAPAPKRVRKSERPEPSEIETLLKGYYISPEMRLAFTTANTMSKTLPEKAVKLMMIGPSGYGKTTLPYLFSRVTQMGFYRMNCATVRDPEEWFGYREARDGSTYFIRSEFIKLVEAGNLVVVLDEFNRLEPWLHNTLFPLLDDDGKTIVHDETFCIGPNVIVVATINNGYRFTGTFELDEALMNRFDFVLEVRAMPRVEEVNVLVNRVGIDKEDARKIVAAAAELRNMDVVCSTRTTLLIARMIMSGMSLREAFESSVVRRISRDESASMERKKVVDYLNVQFGIFSDREVDGDVFELNPEPKKVDPGPEVVPTITEEMFVNRVVLVRNPAMEMNRLYAAATIRLGNPVMTMKQSLEIIDLVATGKRVEVYCSDDNISEMTDKLQKSGISGSYRVIPFTAWVPVYNIV